MGDTASLGEYRGAVMEGMPLPGDPSGQTVQPLQSHTKPIPPKKVEDRYYFSSARNTSFYRKDGMRLVFTSGIFTSNNEPDHKYLDDEIAGGNPYVRVATEEEIHAHKMRVNPRGTLKAEVTAEVEEEMRERLEREIMEKLRSQGIISDETKVAGVDATASVLERLADGVKSGSGTLVSRSFQSSTVGSDKVAGLAAGSTGGASAL